MATQIGSLFVNVGARIGDLEQGMAAATKSVATASSKMESIGTAATSSASAVGKLEKSSTSLAKAATNSHLSMGRLSQELTTVARKALDLEPVVAQVGNVLGTFALGAGPMVAILGGIAAITFAWEKLTKAARESKEETQKAIDALLEMGRKRAQGPFGETPGQGKKAQLEQARLLREIAAVQKQVDIAQFTGATGPSKKLAQLQADLAKVNKAIDDAIDGMMDVDDSLDKPVKKHFEKLSAEAKAAAEAIKEINRALIENQERIAKMMTMPVGLSKSTTQQWGAGLNVGGASGPRNPKALEPFMQGMANAQEGRIATGRGFFEQIKAGFTGGISDIVKQFGPLAAAATALAPVFQGLRDVVGPILSEPLRVLGELIGTSILPVMKLLAVPLRLLNTVVSYVVEGLGWFIEALGKFVDKIVPDWISKAGKGLAQLGRDMQDSARAARSNSEITDEATEATERFAAAMSNVPSGFKIEKRRFESTIGVPSAEGLPTARTSGTSFYGATIHVHGVEDVKTLTDEIERETQRRISRGGGGLTLRYNT